MFGWFKKEKRSELFTLVEKSTKDLSKWEVADRHLWYPSVLYTGNAKPILWEMKKELDYGSGDWVYPIVSPCCLQSEENLALGDILFYSVWEPCIWRDRAARMAAGVAKRNEIAGELYDSVLAQYREGNK